MPRLAAAIFLTGAPCLTAGHIPAMAGLPVFAVPAARGQKRAPA
jgi:hypothetical protein